MDKELCDALEDLICGHFDKCWCMNYDQKLEVAEGIREQLMRHYNIEQNSVPFTWTTKVTQNEQ